MTIDEFEEWFSNRPSLAEYNSGFLRHMVRLQIEEVKPVEDKLQLVLKYQEYFID